MHIPTAACDHGPLVQQIHAELLAAGPLPYALSAKCTQALSRDSSTRARSAALRQTFFPLLARCLLTRAQGAGGIGAQQHVE
jgi:hypothetical protein